MRTNLATTTAIRSLITPQADYRVNPALRRANPAPPPVHASKTLCLVGSSAKHATYEEVCAVIPTRENTYHEKTGNSVYKVVEYATPIDGLRDHVSAALGSDPVYETYALSKDGQQMYGRIAWNSGVMGAMIEVVFRSSYNGTICVEWGIGQGTFICANGMISADQIMKIKHTHNVIERFTESLTDGTYGVAERIEQARKRLDWVDGLREIPMSDDLFNAFVGVLQGRTVGTSQKAMLTPHRASAARKYWGACHAGQLHDDHGQRNLYSGYQALTGANHLSTPRNFLQDGAGVDFMVEAVEASGGSLTGIPAFSFDITEYDA